MPFTLRIIIIILAAYLLGNINIARIIAWKRKHADITKEGSGNPGTMNMLRRYGFKFGLATFILDIIKGALPCVVAAYFLEYDAAEGTLPLDLIFNAPFSLLGVYIAGISVVLGHIFPVVWRFHGGKGVACSIGVFLVCDWLWAIIAVAGGVLVLILLRYGSVTSFFTVTLLVVVEYVKLFTAYQYGSKLAIAILIGAIWSIIIIMHRKNILRLIKGTEPKVERSKIFSSRTDPVQPNP